jgi:hypothetical protein
MCALTPDHVCARSANRRQGWGLSVGCLRNGKDEQGAVIPTAVVRVASSALIGEPATTTTDHRGHDTNGSSTVTSRPMVAVP